MAGKCCLKVISYAYKEMTVEEFNKLITTHAVESAEFRAEIENELIYLGTFGIDDPLIEDICQTVQLIRYGKHVEDDEEAENQVNVRMVTGDHIETAKRVAIKAGIVTESEANTPGVCMTGEEFIDKIGEYKASYDSIKGRWEVRFDSQTRFNELKKTVRVIARTSAEVKFVLVSGIKQKGGLIAMTGDSITDARALQKADVGLAMGSGCDVAKDCSDLVILDNDFVSIYKSILWGRQIFENVRKFLQFQLTINIVICIITVIGGCTIGRTPLNVIQMLWTNLIMDVLGAIALGTEPPNIDQSKAQTTRVSRKDKIITPFMWRQVLVQALYQLIVMFGIMYFGTFIFFDESFNLITEPIRDANGKNTNRLVLDTISFYTFILMNLFNQFNCRLLDTDKEKAKKNINIFTNSLFRTPMFWIITLGEFILTYLMVNAGSSELGSALLGTAELSEGQVITCWVLGAFSLIVNIILKYVPMPFFYYVANKLDLEADADDKSGGGVKGMSNMMNKA